jgi:hypothetical protein
LEVRTEAIHALKILVFKNKTNAMALSALDVITPLMTLLKDKEVGICKHAACYLWNISFYPTSLRTEVEVRSVVLLLMSLLSSKDAKTRRNTSGALCNLALHNVKNSNVIREVGGVEGLIKLLIDDHLNVRIQAASALSKQGLNVSEKEGFTYQLKIESTNEVKYEVITCSDPSNALSALFASVSDETLAAPLHICWLVPCVILLSDTDVNVRRKSAMAMLHFCEVSDNHDIMRDVGGVDMLINLASDSNADIAMYASNALKYLVIDNLNLPVVNDSGNEER